MTESINVISGRTLSYPRGVVRLLRLAYPPGADDFDTAGVLVSELELAGVLRGGGIGADTVIHRVSVAATPRGLPLSFDAIVIERSVFGGAKFPAPVPIALAPSCRPNARAASFARRDASYVAYHGPTIIEAIRDQILRGRLTRNLFRADCYITPTYTYVPLRDACSRVLLALGMDPDLATKQSEFLNSLRSCPEPVQTLQGKLEHWILTTPKAKKPIGALKLRTACLFDPVTLKRLGLYEGEVRTAPDTPRHWR